MPGQRKRGRARERDAGRRSAAGTGLGAGRWEVVLETGDRARLRARVRELGVGQARIDPAAIRVDTLCGRLTRPTVHRLSVFVPADGGGRAGVA